MGNSSVFDLRPATSEDEAFLRDLLTETITIDLHALSWPAPLRNQIVPQQVAARYHAIHGSFPGAESWIVTADREPAGWIYYAVLDDEVRLVEVMIADRHRGRGAGTLAIRHALAAAQGRPVRLHVNVLNQRATRLYERLGFRRVGGDEVQHLMEFWTNRTT